MRRSEIYRYGKNFGFLIAQKNVIYRYGKNTENFKNNVSQQAVNQEHSLINAGLTFFLAISHIFHNAQVILCQFIFKI